MTDRHLRELERRWRESGALIDEVAYLGERLKLGAVDARLLSLAAYVGHEAARTLVEGPHPEINDLREWILGLEAWGDEVCVVVAIVAAQALHGAGKLTGEGVPTQSAVAAAEALIRCPCPDHEKEARKAWTLDAPWAGEVAWAELAAEVAWAAHWLTSDLEVRALVRARVGPWALEPEPKPEPPADA